MDDKLSTRYLAKLAALNMAQIVPNRVVMSPEALFDYQGEITNYNNTLFWDNYNFKNNLQEHIFGIPLEVDPRIEGNRISLEIDI